MAESLKKAAAETHDPGATQIIELQESINPVLSQYFDSSMSILLQ